jgi:prepilin-type N-terminal cleavage/methylation domain-containing protein
MLIFIDNKRMRKNQKGFSLVEILLVIVVIGLIGGIGWYAYSAHSNKTKPITITQPGWLTYRSTNSAITFSYPSNWHLQKLSPATYSSNALEYVKLYGPNSFSMNYYLQTRPTGPNNADCVARPPETTVPINISYSAIIVVGDQINGADITIRAANPNGLIYHNCGTYNVVGSTNLVFTFTGSYNYGSPHYGATSASAYLNLPEVRTAKAIFASFDK